MVPTQTLPRILMASLQEKLASSSSYFWRFFFFTAALSKTYVSGITGMCSAWFLTPQYEFPSLYYLPSPPALSFVPAHRSSSVGLVSVWRSWQWNAYDSGEVGLQSGCLIPGICHPPAKRHLKQWPNGSDLPRKNTPLMYKITTHASHYTIPRTIGTINSLQKVFVYSHAWFTVNHTPEKRREKRIHKLFYLKQEKVEIWTRRCCFSLWP